MSTRNELALAALIILLGSAALVLLARALYQRSKLQ